MEYSTQATPAKTPRFFQPSQMPVGSSTLAILLSMALLPSISLAWGADETMPDNTHRRLSRQAAQLLDENIDRHVELQGASQILQRHMEQLEEGAVAPDYDTQTPYYIGADLVCQRFGQSCRAQNLYNDHFYDADTHEGLRLSSVFIYDSNLFRGPLGDIPPENAESQTRRYLAVAAAKWKDASQAQENADLLEAEALYAEAVYWLGYASHFFSDIFEPHHAGNYPWGPINKSHSEFERLVDLSLDEFLPEEEIAPNDLDYTMAKDPESITAFVTEYANHWSAVAKSQLKHCVRGYFWGFPKQWKSAAQLMARANRDALSLLYFRFLSHVTESLPSLDDFENIGQFNLEIEMGAGFTPNPTEGRPGETVSFSVDFMDGQTKTWVLDTENFYRWYSFNTDAASSFFLDWDHTLPYPSEAVSLRLTRGLGRSSALWEVERLSLYIHGIRVLDVDNTITLAKGEEISIPLPQGLH
jgi:phospholipase C/alpha-toxin